MQRFFHFFRDRFRRFPVIIQLAPVRDYEKVKRMRSLIKTFTKKSSELEIINSFSARLTTKAIKALTHYTTVAKIYYDRDIRTLLDTAVPNVKSPYLWEQACTGKGVTIAVLDTGFFPHPDLLLPTNRILAFKDFVKHRDKSMYDDNGHGTHCIGSAAGNGHSSNGKYRGPAYQANIVALKILNKMGTGKSSVAIQALEWIRNNSKKFNIKIVSLSLGYKATVSYREDPLCQALEEIWNSGIVVCTAAGNEGPAIKTINSPGIDPNLITVGAFNDNNTLAINDNKIADFSSRGPTIDGLTKPDFLLPGANITSARAKGSFLDKISENKAIADWYLELSGTSMATPICAGIIAQILEVNPKLSPPEIKKMLVQSCTKLGSMDGNNQGNGFVDCAKVYSNLNNKQSHI
ncbi:MAG: S8 family peptidase [Clostridia bacterium]|nr:S8 family peptidase [Clostridia bacterium]MDD4047408.1 S8 family peptidase [Clostridia bacterium]